jgi:excisionase family DNA binding protein
MTATETKLLTYKEVAEMLGVTERHVRHLVTQRRIPHVKWGRLIRFNPQQINTWVKDATIDARHEPRRFW